ncbi:MAG: BatD family protein [Crocinitomicaceae bacterium]|nr:protein BatD [Crocinitomicaceae bacterium]
MIKYLYIWLIMLGYVAFSQQADIDIAVNKTTVTNAENFSYQITADCDCKVIEPDFEGFDVLDKSQGQFSSTQILNGVSSKSCSTTITYILRAKKTGNYTIGEAQVKCKNGDKRSNEIAITVVDANQAHEESQGVARFFYELTSTKDAVYVGEPFVLSFSLYSERMPEELNSIVPGNALGTWRQKLFDETDPNHTFYAYPKRIKGKDYKIIELRREVCFADHAGNLHINPYYGVAVERYGFLENSYFEGYSNSLDIQVKEVPGEKPESYYGMAGDFNISASASENTIAANRAFELEVIVEGTGNYHLFKQPDFLFPKSFLVNDPEIEEDFSYTEDGVKGSIKYTYVITPTKEGTYSILPYQLTYFDWKHGRLKTVGTEQISIDVSKGKDPKIISKDPGKNPLIEDDIRFIHKEDPCRFRLEDLFFGHLTYWVLWLLPLFTALAYFLYRKRQANKSEDEVVMEQQRTTKKAVVRDIQKIKGSSTNDIKQLNDRLSEYLMTNLQIGRSALSKKIIAEMLKIKGVDDQTILAFEAIWDKIEMAQYAPLTDENIEVLVEQTQKLIEALNKQL